MIRDWFGIVLGSFWVCFGVVLGLFWGRFGFVLGSFWDRFGIVLGSWGGAEGVSKSSCFWHVLQLGVTRISGPY